jgi:hypothetical protein
MQFRSDMKAFPTEHPIAGMMDLKSDGMDLRDYFAAKAMQGLIGINLSNLQEKYDLKKSEMIAVLAYTYADAMMLARKAKNDS